MKLNRTFAARAAVLALACTVLTACGGETVSHPGSAVEAPSSVSSQPAEPTPTPEPTTAPVAEGSLQLTEKEINLGDYELFTMFKNGYAWVWANGEAGYLSEDGQYTALYSISREDIFNIDVERMTSDGFSLQDNVEKLTDLYSCSESGIVPFYKDGLWGYCDLSGNVLVQPAYVRISPMGQLGWGARESDAGTEYNVLKPDGSVIVSGKNCWCDPRNGYYFVSESDGGIAVLYNADGSVVLEDVPYSFGNCPLPDFTTWEEGVVVSGVPYDRTGAKLGTDGRKIVGITAGSRPVFLDKGGFGILNTNGSVAVPDSLRYISDVMADGSIYVEENGTGVLHHYDSEMNVMADGALARAKAGERYADEERRAVIAPVEICDQDGQQIALLESEVDMGEVFSQADGVLKVGDWFYLYATDTTVQTYQFTPAE
ncbi:hypothetical protein [Candidatus Allofournierella merdipullorum]|uniref:hypothetical protein n=1 Tax=Candidatus Allofournierella merdipullorum TaxID=2838595 RepID=UPI002A8DC427|nr:hypothetical protein [Candidatus Fournierella merdipullorum]